MFLIFKFLLLASVTGPLSSNVSGNEQSESKSAPAQLIKTEADTVAEQKTQDLKDTIFYESDLINYDSDSRVLHLNGNAMVKYQNISLYADTIVYTIENDILNATGRPQLIEGNDTTIGDFMAYNIKTKRGRVRYASTRVTDGYFTGQNIIKSDENELYVDQGDYTTCAHIDSPDFFFYGKNIKLIPNDKIISRPVVLNIGDAPVAVLPYFIFPIQRNRRSGLLTPVWGGHPTGGGYIDNVGYYYAPNDYIDLTLRGKVSEFENFVIEGSSKYALKYRLDGGIKARYALNSDFLKGGSQWAIDYSHNQNITPDGLTKLFGRGNLTSQKSFYTEHSEDNTELLNQKLDANLSLSQTFKNINASGNLTWQRTHNLKDKIVSENLPSFSFRLPDRPIIPPSKTGSDEETDRWYNKVYYNYDLNGIGKREENRSISPFETSFHPGFKQSLNISSPQKLFEHITLNPGFSTRISSFYGYMDTAIIRYDTIYNSVSDTLKPPFTDSRYSESEWPVTRRDTLSFDNYGNPDSIVVTRTKQTVSPFREKHDNEFGHDAIWNAGVKLSTDIYGIFPIKIFNFAGLRHTFSPSLSYTFHPEHYQDKKYYDIGIPYSKAQEKRQLLGVSINNQFDGKVISQAKPGEKPVERKFPVLSTSLSTNYDFEKDSLKWSNLSLSAATSYKSISLRYSSSFWLYDQKNNLTLPSMKEMNLSLSTGSLGASGKLWGGDLLVLDSINLPDPVKYNNAGPQGWHVNITPSYTFSMSRDNPTEMFVPQKRYSLNASAGLNFTRNWSVRWSGVYNFVEDQWMQNSFNIFCDLECWDMRFEWRPEKLNPGYYFLVNIKKIPEIKWEKRD